METSISSKSDSLQMVYNNYVNHKYVVNRRYQRKLVWTLEEKAAFIDSIVKSYSVPLFLLAQKNLPDNQVKYEIIDGMQRLNAICSFVEDEFPVKYNGNLCYFDLDTLADTMALKGTVLNQKTPKLPKEVCLKISNYQFPFSFIIAYKEDIEEIFRRINSYGKKLSEQEIRQAGALGAFPDLIRKTSADIRGDVSLTDLVPLEEMKRISLTNKGLSYGIDVNSLFWTQNGIVTRANIRVSRDEELVAHIYAYVLLGNQVAPSSHTLDVLYDLNLDTQNIASKANDAIRKYGFDNLINNFRKVFDSIQTVLEKANKTFKMLIFNDEKASGAVRSFQVVFLAFYELMVRDDKEINDINALLNDLDGIGRRNLKNIAGDEWNAKYRIEKIRAIKGIIDKDFKQRKGNDIASENWVSRLENLLQLSMTEGCQYDFKQGFYTLDNKSNSNKNKFDSDLIKKCLKTLTAQVNKEPHTKGYIICGVSDKKSDAERIKTIYGIDYKTYNDSRFFISGLNGEIERYHNNNPESYLRKIKDAIRANKDIDEYTKTYVLTHMKFVSYYGLNVLILSLESKDNPIAYNDSYYIRENDETKEIIGVKGILALQKMFADNI